MSVDNSGVVDAVGMDDTTGQVVLTISDHLEWDNDHLMLLQEKINTYMSFIESGELAHAYPKSKGREILINVVCKYPPNEYSKSFLNQVSNIIEKSGVKFTHQVFPMGN